MTKAEVIAEIAKKTGLERADIQLAIQELFSTIQNAVECNHHVHFSGFGSFSKKKRARKIGRNISTNTAIVIDEHHIPHFKPSRSFIDKVKNSPQP